MCDVSHQEDLTTMGTEASTAARLPLGPKNVIPLEFFHTSAASESISANGSGNIDRFQEHNLFMKRLLFTLLIFSGITSASADSFPNGELVGGWYQGDGLGYNVTLTLNTDGSYIASWRGCLGLYGTAAGNWKVDEDVIVLTPASETDMMVGHLRTLKILSRHGAAVLANAADHENRFGFESDERVFTKQPDSESPRDVTDQRS